MVKAAMAKLKEARKAANAAVGVGEGKGYGCVYVQKITNKSNDTVYFVNPYGVLKTGNIAPGYTEDSNACHGYIPRYDEPQKYEIYYANTAVGHRVMVAIKDLGDWLISFEQDRQESIHEIAIYRPLSTFPIEIIVLTNGFEIFDLQTNNRKGGMLYWPAI